jgi:hypothetical protein
LRRLRRMLWLRWLLLVLVSVKVRESALLLGEARACWRSGRRAVTWSLLLLGELLSVCLTATLYIGVIPSVPRLGVVVGM